MNNPNNDGDEQMISDHSIEFTEKKIAETVTGWQFGLAVRRICLIALRHACAEFQIEDLVVPIAAEDAPLWIPAQGGQDYYASGPTKTDFREGPTVHFRYDDFTDMGLIHVKIRKPSHMIRRHQWDEYDQRARESEEPNGQLPWVVVDLNESLAEQWELLLKTPPQEGDFAIPQRRPSYYRYRQGH
jgi:hypothetical protein